VGLRKQKPLGVFSASKAERDERMEQVRASMR
jgi:hypothetical protein